MMKRKYRLLSKN